MVMAIYSYPPEVHEFVRTHCTEMRDDKLAEACNAALGTNFTKSKMKSFRANHGYKNGFGSLNQDEIWGRMYPAGMVDFIRDNSWGVSSARMAEMVNARFGTSFSTQQIKTFRARHHIHSGEKGWYPKGHSPGTKGKTFEEICGHDPEKIRRAKSAWFKKGHTPANKVPVGTIKTTVDGYKLIKVSETGSQWERWRALHRHTWEKHNGPIPPGMKVTFKDGNRMNCDIDNLILVSAGELSVMNMKGYRFDVPELTEAAIATIRLQRAAARKRKGQSNDGNS